MWCGSGDSYLEPWEEGMWFYCWHAQLRAGAAARSVLTPDRVYLGLELCLAGGFAHCHANFFQHELLKLPNFLCWSAPFPCSHCLFLSLARRKEEIQILRKGIVFCRELVINFKIRDVAKLHRPESYLQLK